MYLSFRTGADWLYFSAQAQFDQTGPQIVENVNQWAEMLRNADFSMLSRTFPLRQSALRPASPPLAQKSSKASPEGDLVL